ncbi:MAG: Gfo/Idh/MocA family oxidoreductase [Verrucomicrobiae bacterium]|nr:Gfo/Idh/MocA family oxidoreductase [Verrucomicrobiae bacterium]
MRKISRRTFLAATAALAAGWRLPPSERIAVGLIGLGAMGRGHLALLLGHPAAQVVAVCDVDRVRREEARQLAKCDAYNDSRDLLARSAIDAVVIATPDHWHTLQAIHAAQAGKDVYCEKPVSLTIREGRELADAMRRYGRVFQTGTQYRSMRTIHKICGFIRAGKLGRIKQVFTIWGKSGDSYLPGDPVLPAEPVPEGLDWDLWVGPAPWRPYNHRYHRNPVPGVVPWAFCEAFGAGAITGYHSHAADVIQYALGLETSGPVELVHPNSGEFPTLTCRYSTGTLLHLVEDWGMVQRLYNAVPATARLAGNFGGVFVGEHGWITTMYGAPIEGEPESVFEELGLKSREIDPANNHHDNWLDCIRTRAQPSSHAEIGHRSASLGHLTAVAYKLGRSLKWDPARETFVGDEEASRLLSRAYREPWRI